MRKLKCDRCGRERQLYHKCRHCKEPTNCVATEPVAVTEADEPFVWDRRPSREEPVVIADLIGTALAASVAPGYEHLAATLQEALDQSQAGKGKERHARGRTFDRQPIMEIGRMVGVGYPTGQASKKIQEAVGMFNRDEADRAVNELLGAIIYSAAAILLIRETRKDV